MSPPSDIDGTLLGLPGLQHVDVPLAGFDPLFVLKPRAQQRLIARHASAPDMRAYTTGQKDARQVAAGGSPTRVLPRTMSTDRMVRRKSSTGKIVVNETPQITRSGSSKDDSDYVENLLKQNQKLSKVWFL